MDKLVEFLKKMPEVADVKRTGSAEGPAARFSQVNIWVKKECIPSCDGQGSGTVNVNYYASGKCILTGVSSLQVAKDVAVKVTSLLMQAFVDDDSGVREHYDPRDKSRKRKK
mmetsp:Transcript_72985/g.194811  ORF Transcript_72985/g.194811 Transcript_72985/m.194811 type:complete len:112 (+) Transcript_72985:89-424(+)